MRHTAAESGNHPHHKLSFLSYRRLIFSPHRRLSTTVAGAYHQTPTIHVQQPLNAQVLLNNREVCVAWPRDQMLPSWRHPHGLREPRRSHLLLHLYPPHHDPALHSKDLPRQLPNPPVRRLPRQLPSPPLLPRLLPRQLHRLLQGAESAPQSPLLGDHKESSNRFMILSPYLRSFQAPPIVPPKKAP